MFKIYFPAARVGWDLIPKVFKIKNYYTISYNLFQWFIKENDGWAFIGFLAIADFKKLIGHIAK